MYKIQKPTIPAEIVGDIGGILTDLDTLGLSDSLTEVRKWHAHAESLAADRRTAETDAAALTERLTQALAVAEITADEAVDQLVEARHRADRADVATTVLRMAFARAARLTFAALTTEGDTIATAVLEPALSAITDKARKLAIPAEVHTDEDALRAGSKTTAAWQEATALTEDVDLIQSIADRLRQWAVITTPEDRDSVPKVFYRYRRPEALPTYDNPPERTHRFLDSLDAVPAVLTAKELPAQLDSALMPASYTEPRRVLAFVGGHRGNDNPVPPYHRPAA